MFKRLFIGLLILSALTAEGTAFFNTALAPFHSYMTCLYSEEDDIGPDINGIPVKPAGLVPDRFAIHAFVSIEEIINSRDNRNATLCLPFSFSSLYYPVVYRHALINNEIIRDNSYILFASDISPPV